MSTSRHMVSIDQLIALNDEIIALTKNGVPLESGLLHAGADFQGSITRLTIALASRMQKGETLDQAIEREPSNVPPIYRTIVESGLRTGRLSVALEGVSRFARQIMEIRQMIGLSMLYPLIVVSFAYILFLVFLGELLARFRAFYTDAHFQFSLPIQFLTNLSATSAYWNWIPPVLLIFLIWSWHWGNRVSMFQLSGPLQFIPGMKQFHRRLQLATFSDLLAILVEQQVPLPEALPLAAEASADPQLASSVEVLVKGIRNGLPNSGYAQNQQGLPPFIFWLLTSNQNSPTLVPALRQAGQMYRREALRQRNAMRVWFPVTAVVVVGGGAVLFYALVLFAPPHSPAGRHEPMKSTFHYQAIDGSGQIVKGRMEAVGIDDVASQLLRVGLTPKLIEMMEAPPVPSDRLTISPKDFGILTGHVSDLVTAQLPLSAGLRAIAEEHASGHLREAILKLASELDRGKSLAEALKSINAPSDLGVLLNAGLDSHRMDQLLNSYLAQAQVMRDLHSTTFGAMLYPAILLGSAFSLILTLLIGLAPGFTKIFNDFGTELPGMTLLFINLSQLLTRHGVEIFFGFTAVVIVGWAIAKWLVPPSIKCQIVYRIPVIGPMIQWATLSRLCHRLALLIENRIPMPDALQAAGDATRSAYYSEVTRNLAIAVISGKDLAQSAKAMHSFPPSLIQALGWSAPQTTLAESLHAVGDMYEARSRMQSTWLISIIEPIVTSATGIIVGMFVIAMFMPLIKLLNDLS